MRMSSHQIWRRTKKAQAPGEQNDENLEQTPDCCRPVRRPSRSDNCNSRGRSETRLAGPSSRWLSPQPQAPQKQQQCRRSRPQPVSSASPQVPSCLAQPTARPMPDRRPRLRPPITRLPPYPGQVHGAVGYQPWSPAWYRVLFFEIPVVQSLDRHLHHLSGASSVSASNFPSAPRTFRQQASRQPN